MCGLVLSALAGCDAIHDLQRGILFQPEHGRPDPRAADRVEGLERWELEIEGGTVEAWYLPPIGERAGPSPVVVFAHGNRELIDHWPERLEPYRRMGVAVLLPEYRGYGRSAGVPGEAAILADFARFYDRLLDRPDVDPARVVLHGYSLGGGVVGALSARRRPAAMVLESTFTNVPDVASAWLAPAAFIRDRFDTRAVLERSSTPVLILHGLEDTLVPFKHARELHRVAWDSRLISYHAGHQLPHTEAGYWRRIRAFLLETGVLSDAPATAAPVNRR